MIDQTKRIARTQEWIATPITEDGATTAQPVVSILDAIHQGEPVVELTVAAPLAFNSQTPPPARVTIHLQERGTERASVMAAVLVRVESRNLPGGAPGPCHLYTYVLSEVTSHYTTWGCPQVPQVTQGRASSQELTAKAAAIYDLVQAFGTEEHRENMGALVEAMIEAGIIDAVLRDVGPPDERRPASEALKWAEREFEAARQSPGEPGSE